MRVISKEALQALCERFPKGARVELLSMDDPYTKLCPGDQGAVIAVDDIGTVHIAWDSGSSLGAAYGVDRIRRIEP